MGYASKIKVLIVDLGWPKGGRDACQGDSGGPLVTNLPGHFQMLRYNDIDRKQRRSRLKKEFNYIPKVKSFEWEKRYAK